MPSAEGKITRNQDQLGFGGPSPRFSIHIHFGKAPARSALIERVPGALQMVGDDITLKIQGAIDLKPTSYGILGISLETLGFMMRSWPISWPMSEFSEPKYPVLVTENTQSVFISAASNTPTLVN
jgi:hypothetical protein